MPKLRKSTIVAVLTILIICIPYFFPLIKSLALQTDIQGIDVNVMPSPAIDIVLAKSKTQTDVTSFEEDLKKELINQGISSDKIKINAVEAVEANIQDSFSWKTDVSSKVGSISITNAGQDIVMKGNKKYPGKNAIWIIPEKEQEQEIKFDYSVDFGDSFNAAGMLLRVKQTENTLTGYMLSLNKSGKTWYKTAGNKYGAIWKFTYKIGDNTSNMTKTFVKGLNIATSGTLNIKSTDTKIKISGGSLKSPIEYIMDTDYGHGFGFFSDHYSHNCSKIGAFKLGNIKLVTTTVKKFKEVLSNPEWRENSLRFLVNVDDYENKELQDKSSLADLESRLVNEEIHSIFWGTEQNQEQANKIIKGNNGNGIFTDNTDYKEAINSTAQYIKKLINTSKTSQYAIVGEEVGLKVTPESIKNDTITSEYPNGKWKINHDYKYFENDLGKSKNSGKYMSDLSMSFDKTGRYELLYGDEKIISKYIYVHRKPVANFNVLKQGNNVKLTSTSYDLDSYSNNKGIAEEEWKYKKVEETKWTDGKLTQVEPDEVYMVQLKVQDFQETWSMPMTKYVMSNDEDSSSTPVANFTIKNSNISKYEDLQIENTSYDPAGLNITEQTWKVKKDEKVVYTGSTPLTNYKDYEVGTYTISLIVKNELGKASEEFTRKIQVGDDTVPPTVDGTPDDLNSEGDKELEHPSYSSPIEDKDDNSDVGDKDDNSDIGDKEDKNDNSDIGDKEDKDDTSNTGNTGDTPDTGNKNDVPLKVDSNVKVQRPVNKVDVSKRETNNDKVNTLKREKNTNKVNKNQNIQKNNKKFKKEKLPEALPYTGGEERNIFVTIAFIILIFNSILGIKVLFSGREIEYQAKRYK